MDSYIGNGFDLAVCDNVKHKLISRTEREPVLRFLLQVGRANRYQTSLFLTGLLSLSLVKSGLYMLLSPILFQSV
uniref:Uncharacterized protein n=1 Tax=Salmo trutta TaxID=8032 RepID=A0A674CQW0_SALTR